jgi:hypothetical protein
MRIRTVALAAAAALAVAAAALGAPAVKDPKTLILTRAHVPAHAGATAKNPALRLALQRKDMPANVEGGPLGPVGPRETDQDSLDVLGTGLKGADYFYKWPAGGTVNAPGLGAIDKEWRVSGDVVVAPSVAAARKLFAGGKAAQTGFFSDFPTDEDATPLRLPSYGEEQLALLGKDADGPEAMVFVRKGLVVWELRVGHSPSKWAVTKAQVVGLLETYAKKQKARVGAG